MMRIIYIAGRGHSGSTLLDFLLSGHEQVTGIGEIINLKKWLGSETEKTCTCGRQLSECSFWSPILRRIPATVSALSGGQYSLWASRRETLGRLVGRKRRGKETISVEKHEEALLDSIATVSGCDILVDSSKHVGRLLRLNHIVPERLYVIHLSKSLPVYKKSCDRRGVGVTECISSWLKDNALLRLLSRRLSHYIFVRYEDLVSDPEAVLKQICQWIGIAWDPGMMHAYLDSEHHNIGGNRMRWRPEPIHQRESAARVNKVINVASSFLYPTTGTEARGTARK